MDLSESDMSTITKSIYNALDGRKKGGSIIELKTRINNGANALIVLECDIDYMSEVANSFLGSEEVIYEQLVELLSLDIAIDINDELININKERLSELIKKIRHELFKSYA